MGRQRLILVALCALCGICLVAAAIVPTYDAKQDTRGSSPVEVATPSASPTQTPIQSPSATATQSPKPPWEFGAASLSIPAAAVNGEITPYTQAEKDANGGVEPPGMFAISWDTTIPDSELSSSTMNTIYLYCHSWIKEAICNDVRKLQPGATATIDSTATDGSKETLDFVMSQPVFTVSKPDYATDPRVGLVDQCRLVVVSCYRPDDYPEDASTVENVIAIFERSSPTCG